MSTRSESISGSPRRPRRWLSRLDLSVASGGEKPWEDPTAEKETLMTPPYCTNPNGHIPLMIELQWGSPDNSLWMPPNGPTFVFYQSLSEVGSALAKVLMDNPSNHGYRIVCSHKELVQSNM